VAAGRRNRIFAGSDEDGHRAAAISTLIETAKLNEVSARLQDHPAKRINELLPWNWKTVQILRTA